MPTWAALAFALCMALFSMQAVAPQIDDVPFHVLLLALIFFLIGLTRPLVLMDACGALSGVQWVGILTLFSLACLRVKLNYQDLLGLLHLGAGLMVLLIGASMQPGSPPLQILVFVLALTVAASGTVAIFQFAVNEPFLWSWTVYVGYGYVYGSTGLENTPVPFAYSVLGIGSVLCGSLILYHTAGIGVTPFGYFSTVVLSLTVLGGLAASASRSGIVGLATAYLITFTVRIEPTWARGSRTRLPGLVGIVLVAGLVAFAATMRDEDLFEDVRFLGAWETFAPAILANPLGLSADNEILDAVSETEAAIDPRLERGERLMAPHNIILSTGLTYGPLGVLAVVLVYAGAFARGVGSLRFFRSIGRSTEAAWVALLMSANLAILVHCWFHNASIALGEMRNWLWLGLLAAAGVGARR